MATIATEDDFNAAIVAADGNDVWTGLEDGDAESIWTWADGSDISSNYGFNADGTAITGTGPWASGEPNNSGNEDCVEIWSKNSYNDIECSDSNYPLCNSSYEYLHK